ncbi:PEGA domain-containing protein [Pseudodesulfovibrio portus]|uniref:PEGA domain-containing protein n=1 Tax=Pseudodesulfovibrio portus TaxID=231439 RepID=A0ABN6RVN1_9BACT|nr:PEGA domain-containing protein [Pseudodesulfovibrio portus]BDQ33565.1 hypothetical protein JCM14722_11070 [Pseudodesulfovibrio portus]
MSRPVAPLLAVACLLALAACGVPKQKIPVSTDPIGAAIYLDGEKQCTSPCAVRADKQGDHLLTIVKEGYEQEEIILKRQFKPDRALRDGVISGIIRGGGAEGVAKETAREVDEQERSGEAYVLTPSIVTIRLTPKGDRL